MLCSILLVFWAAILICTFTPTIIIDQRVGATMPFQCIWGKLWRNILIILNMASFHKNLIKQLKNKAITDWLEKTSDSLSLSMKKSNVRGSIPMEDVLWSDSEISIDSYNSDISIDSHISIRTSQSQWFYHTT